MAKSIIPNDHVHVVVAVGAETTLFLCTAVCLVVNMLTLVRGKERRTCLCFFRWRQWSPMFKMPPKIVLCQAAQMQFTLIFAFLKCV